MFEKTKGLIPEVERCLEAFYIGAPGARLRLEDRKKAVEVSGMLAEIDAAAGRLSRRGRLVLVDAAAGKSYVGILAAKLIFEPSGRDAEVVTLERDAARAAASREAARVACTRIPIDCREADITSRDAWPAEVSIVTALHACGPAADAVIDVAVERGVRTLLLVPCCTGNAVAAAGRAAELARTLGVPPHAPVRRRFIQAAVDAERTWRLEAAGYETEVVEFVSATVTPHNLLWRARRVCERGRMAEAARMHQLWVTSRDRGARNAGNSGVE